ncbi:4-hydroxyphenylpyruvate dioxygenase, partial [mine drainage metagenome]
SYLLSQGDARFIFTSFLKPDDFVGKHVLLHGDGVKDISFIVPEMDVTIRGIEERKVIKPAKVEKVKTDNGTILKSSISTFGDTVHSLLDLGEYEGNLPPGFIEIEDDTKSKGIKLIDHIVGNVEEKKMDNWVNYYINGLGFKQLMSFDDKDISTEYSALQSKVVEYNNRKIVFPINEPAWGLKKSQIQEYLDYYKSPGVQHIAFLTDDIIDTVGKLKKAGIEFLKTPAVYYEDLEDRVGK